MLLPKSFWAIQLVITNSVAVRHAAQSLLSQQVGVFRKEAHTSVAQSNMSTAGMKATEPQLHSAMTGCFTFTRYYVWPAEVDQWSVHSTQNRTCVENDTEAATASARRGPDPASSREVFRESDHRLFTDENRIRRPIGDIREGVLAVQCHWSGVELRAMSAVGRCWEI